MVCCWYQQFHMGMIINWLWCFNNWSRCWSGLLLFHIVQSLCIEHLAKSLQQVLIKIKSLVIINLLYDVDLNYWLFMLLLTWMLAPSFWIFPEHWPSKWFSSILSSLIHDQWSWSWWPWWLWWWWWWWWYHDVYENDDDGDDEPASVT